MSEMDTLARTKLWFEKAVPAPKNRNFHTQMGVHFEEVAEMIMEIQTGDPRVKKLRMEALIAIQALSNSLKGAENLVVITNSKNYLDSLCDQIVTAVGCAHMSDHDIVGGMIAVNKSNFSKFVGGNPLFDENGKVKKGPDYEIVDLTPFL